MPSIAFFFSSVVFKEVPVCVAYHCCASHSFLLCFGGSFEAALERIDVVLPFHDTFLDARPKEASSCHSAASRVTFFKCCTFSTSSFDSYLQSAVDIVFV